MRRPIHDFIVQHPGSSVQAVWVHFDGNGSTAASNSSVLEMSVRLQVLLVLCLSCLATSQNADVSRNNLEKVIEDLAVSAMMRVASSLTSNCERNNLIGDTGDQPFVKAELKEGIKNSGKSCQPRDCVDVARSGHTSNGVYRVWPDGWPSCHGMDVYCDLQKDGGGWTVIQRRGKFGSPKDYFFRRWRDYKFGFGNLTQDFWLGNEKLHYLSNQDNYVLRVDLTSYENESRYAQYDEFYLENEVNKYRLWVNLFKGEAGDSLSYHNGKQFSTNDRDNDGNSGNCAQNYKAGWWYDSCHYSNLNGLQHDEGHDAASDGINWRAWKGLHYSFPESLIRIRPKFYP